MHRSKQGNGVAVLSTGVLLAFALIVALPGCGKGVAGSRNRLDDLEVGSFFRTAELTRPRYEHRALTLDDGTVFVNGGSDERCFTSIDVCELFDQKLVVEPEPPSLSGGWINTDFEGEDLRLQDGGRIFHTATRMSEGNVLLIGGAPDGIIGDSYVHPEFYDRNTRKFTVLTAAMKVPRFHHTTVPVTEGEFLVIGGQIGVKMTIVDPNYPPNDPRFIQEINTNPSTNIIEVFDSSLESDDGFGDFVLLIDNKKLQVKLPGNTGRTLHATVRIGGVDNALGNAGDVFISVGGLQTMSPLFAPRTKMRRMGAGALQPTLDVYDGFMRACFTAPGIFMQFPRAHAVMAENLGVRGDVTIDGYHGLSNTFLVFGGSDDGFPTTGVTFSEGFSASYSGFGPGGGIQLTRLEPQAGDGFDSIVDTLNGTLTTDPALVALIVAGIPPNVGKYFSAELLNNPQYGRVISRVHTECVNVVRNVYTDYGPQMVGNLLTGAGGWFYVVMGAQVEIYDNAPVASVEYFDPYFSNVNAFFDPPRTPYDLSTMRQYWSVKLDVPLPTPADNNGHPNPAGIDGTWLMSDGFLPGDGYEGSQLIPPFTANSDDIVVRFMEKGRAWHTVTAVAGANGLLGDTDDRVLFAGGGEGVATWGGMPIIPSAILYVPPASR